MIPGPLREMYYIGVIWGIMENKMETIGIIGYIFPKLGVPFMEGLGLWLKGAGFPKP